MDPKYDIFIGSVPKHVQEVAESGRLVEEEPVNIKVRYSGIERDVELEFLSGTEGHEIRFPDGRSVLMTTPEMLAVAMILFHSASMHEEAMRSIRGTLIASFTGNLANIVTELQIKLASLNSGPLP